MKCYITSSTDRYTHFNIACSFEGKYSEDWDADLLNSVLDKVFKVEFGYSYWGVEMYEWPDLYDDDEWLVSSLIGMGISVCCKPLANATCEKIVESLIRELGAVGYEVADINYEVL